MEVITSELSYEFSSTTNKKILAIDALMAD